jgi:hypothetical protein
VTHQAPVARVDLPAAQAAAQEILVVDRDVLVVDRDVLVVDRDVLAGDRDVLVVDRDVLMGDQEARVVGKTRVVPEAKVVHPVREARGAPTGQAAQAAAQAAAQLDRLAKADRAAAVRAGGRPSCPGSTATRTRRADAGPSRHT